jgi:hypothetical protein
MIRPMRAVEHPTVVPADFAQDRQKTHRLERDSVNLPGRVDRVKQQEQRLAAILAVLVIACLAFSAIVWWQLLQ